MSKADVFERIAASVPQNATAAKVVAKGTHYESKVEYGSYAHFETPPPMVPVPNVDSAQGIVGRRFGRLIVIGLAADQNQNKNSRWVCRCACGDYEYRKAKAIRNPVNTDDKCRKCNQLEVNKKRYARLGGMSLDELAERSR